MECPRCNIVYCKDTNIPLLLIKCGHTICNRCAMEIFNDKSIICPECSIASQINSVSNLPMNMALLSISPAKSIEEKQYELCQIHNKKLEGFCLDDLKPLCIDCILIGGHKSHDISSIPKAYDKQILVLKNNLETINKHEETLKSMVSGINKLKLDLKCKIEEKTNKITILFKDIVNIINERENKLKDNITKNANKCESCLYITSKQIEDCLKNISKYKNSIDKFMNEGMCELLSKCSKRKILASEANKQLPKFPVNIQLPEINRDNELTVLCKILMPSTMKNVNNSINNFQNKKISRSHSGKPKDYKGLKKSIKNKKIIKSPKKKTKAYDTNAKYVDIPNNNINKKVEAFNLTSRESQGNKFSDETPIVPISLIMGNKQNDSESDYSLSEDMKDNYITPNAPIEQTNKFIFINSVPLSLNEYHQIIPSTRKSDNIIFEIVKENNKKNCFPNINAKDNKNYNKLVKDSSIKRIDEYTMGENFDSMVLNNNLNNKNTHSNNNELIIKGKEDYIEKKVIEEYKDNKNIIHNESVHLKSISNCDKMESDEAINENENIIKEECKQSEININLIKNKEEFNDIEAINKEREDLIAESLNNKEISLEPNENIMVESKNNDAKRPIPETISINPKEVIYVFCKVLFN